MEALKPVRPVAMHVQCATSMRMKAVPCVTALKSWRRKSKSNRIVMSVTPGKSYAQAIADVARSQKVLDEVYKDFEKLGEIVKYKSLTEFLNNPTADPIKKKSILKTLADDSKFQPCTVNFLFLLADKRRLDVLGDIVKEFEESYNEMTDTVVAELKTVVKPDTKQVGEIAKIVQSFTGAKNVRIKNVLDPSLVAGFTIKFGSNLIDFSLKSELEKLASQIGADQKLPMLGR